MGHGHKERPVSCEKNYDCSHFTPPCHVRSTEGQVDTSDEVSSESGDSEAQQQGDNTNNIIRNQ